VARLTLEDIDWREGTIRVPNHKRGRPYQLPLPDGWAKRLPTTWPKGAPLHRGEKYSFVMRILVELLPRREP